MKLPWKKIAIACGIMTLLILGRVAVTLGRASYWGSDWLGPIQTDPWVYVGFLVAALGIIAWTKLPGKQEAQPETQEEVPAQLPTDEAEDPAPAPCADTDQSMEPPAPLQP